MYNYSDCDHLVYHGLVDNVFFNGNEEGKAAARATLGAANSDALFELRPRLNAEVKGINHRGWYEAPENTIPAFIASFNKGFKYVECDVDFTKDGVPVLLHDSTIDRTSDGHGNLSSYTFAELQAFDFGSWKSATYAGTRIPSFDQFMEYCRGLGLRPYVEIKGTQTEANLKKVVDIVHKYEHQHVTSYISFNMNNLKLIHKIDPDARLGWLSYDPGEQHFVELCTCRGDTNEVFMDLGITGVLTYLPGLCKKYDVGLEVWCMDTTTEMAPFYKSIVTGITSNKLSYPNVLEDEYDSITPPPDPWTLMETYGSADIQNYGLSSEYNSDTEMYTSGLSMARASIPTFEMIMEPRTFHKITVKLSNTAPSGKTLRCGIQYSTDGVEKADEEIAAHQRISGYSDSGWRTVSHNGSAPNTFTYKRSSGYDGSGYMRIIFSYSDNSDIADTDFDEIKVYSFTTT